MQASHRQYTREIGVPIQWALLCLGLVVGPMLFIYWTVQDDLGTVEVLIMTVLVSGLWVSHLTNGPKSQFYSSTSSEAFFATYLGESFTKSFGCRQRVVASLWAIAALAASVNTFHMLGEAPKIALIILCICAVRSIVVSVRHMFRRLFAKGGSPGSASMGTDQQFVVRLATKMMTYTLASCFFLRYGGAIFGLGN